MKKIVNGHLVVDIAGMPDSEIRETVAEIIRDHPRKGAINILEALPNAPLAEYVKESTSFLDGHGFEFSFATRCYAFANGITSAEGMPHCKRCGKLIQSDVASVHKGFKYKYCSSKCSANSETTKSKRTATNIELHGDPNWNNHEQTEKTCEEKYGFKCSLQNEEVKAKSRAKKEELYGNPYYVNSEQSVKTKFEIYGMGANGKAISEGKRKAAEEDPEYYAKQLEKRQATNIANGRDPNWNNHEQTSKTKEELYGDPNWNNHEQTSKTKAERYGDPNWNNLEHRIKTCQEKYGVDHYTESNEFAEKREATCLRVFGTKNFVQSEIGRAALSEARNKMTFERFLADSNKTRPLFGVDEYMEKTSKGSFRWKCLECGKEFEAPVNFIFAREAGSFARCLDCHPVTFTRSRKQDEMCEFIAGLVGAGNVRKDDRKAIYPKEIDAFVPDLKLGFEFDGLFWHSAYWNSNLTHLSEKTGMAADRGIAICHVFEDEWDLRRKAVEHRISRALLGGGRKTGKDFRVEEADWASASRFYEKNSTDLFVRESDFSRCLVDGSGNAVAMISFNANAGKIVINAFQDAVGTGFSDCFKRLTDAAAEEFSGKASEMSYKADARWPDVSIFDGTGFEFVKFTTPIVWLVDSARWVRVRSNVNRKTMSEFFEKKLDGRPLIDQLHELNHTVVADCGKALFRAKTA